MKRTIVCGKPFFYDTIRVAQFCMQKSSPTYFILKPLVRLCVIAPSIRITKAMAAYAFSKINFKGKDIIFIIFISSLMIPKEIMILPLFRITQQFGMVNSYNGMIWPNVAGAFGVFLLKGFFDLTPNALREAGRIDGANEWRIFTRSWL